MAEMKTLTNVYLVMDLYVPGFSFISALIFLIMLGVATIITPKQFGS